MHGKICVVTGATGGIGGATAIALARRGATVGVVARDATRGAAMAEQVAAAGGAARLFLADLSRQAEVRRLAAEVAAAFPRVDVLVDNAGTFSWRRRRTEDGVELQWAVNHVAPYLLTRLLLPHLRRAEAGRIVVVSSESHRHGRIDPADPSGEGRRYSGLGAYAATKLANLLFTRELASRLGPGGVTVNAMHPGVVATEILLGSFPPLRLLRGRMRTPEEGARTVVYLAEAAEVAGRSGEYWQDERPRHPAPAALDGSLARALWEWSERAVGGIGAG